MNRGEDMVKIKNVYQDRITKKWYFRAYLGTDENGKKIQKTKKGYATQREAKRAYDRFTLTHGLSPTLSTKESSPAEITFKEFYQVRFQNWYEKTVKAQTFENAQFIFEKKMRYFYFLKLRDITSEDIEDWMTELSQTAPRHPKSGIEHATLSKNYVNRILGHLRIVLARAVKMGIIEKNPVDDVVPYTLENMKVEFWEIEEFKKVMDSIPETSLQNIHRKLVFELLFYTGIRIGELEALTWKNVDLAKNRLTVDKTLIYKTKDNWYLSTPKTKNAYRNIGIGQKLSNKLAVWKDLQKRIGNFEYVCQLDGTFTPPYCFSSWLKDFAEKAGVRKIKLHALRHSHVAMLIDQNVQPLVIQERLGHANIRITLGTYGHLYEKSDEQVVNVLDELIPEPVIP